MHHVPFDLNFHAKQHGSALLDSLVPLLDACLDVTGLLVHKSPDGPQVTSRPQAFLAQAADAERPILRCQSNMSQLLEPQVPPLSACRCS